MATAPGCPDRGPGFHTTGEPGDHRLQVFAGQTGPGSSFDNLPHFSTLPEFQLLQVWPDKTALPLRQRTEPIQLLLQPLFVLSCLNNSRPGADDLPDGLHSVQRRAGPGPGSANHFRTGAACTRVFWILRFISRT